jgi:hypothetical protein
MSKSRRPSSCNLYDPRGKANLAAIFIVATIMMVSREDAKTQRYLPPRHQDTKAQSGIRIWDSGFRVYQIYNSQYAKDNCFSSPSSEAVSHSACGFISTSIGLSIVWSVATVRPADPPVGRADYAHLKREILPVLLLHGVGSARTPDCIDDPLDLRSGRQHPTGEKITRLAPDGIENIKDIRYKIMEVDGERDLAGENAVTQTPLERGRSEVPGIRDRSIDGTDAVSMLPGPARHGCRRKTRIDR